MDWEKVKERLGSLPGQVSFFWKNLETGENVSIYPETPHIAASMIKLFLMAVLFEEAEAGRLSLEEKITVTRRDCVPSCGVLNYLQGERTLSLRDLIELMIIVSDNTAANLLFDRLGADRIQEGISRLGFSGQTRFCRKMFDAVSSAAGIENYVTAADIADLLERIYRRTLVSSEASAAMENILSHQRLNGKIPFILHTLQNAPRIAHKTGEDTRTTHDAGLIFAPQPFLLCFLGNDTDVPALERLMGEIAAEIYPLCDSPKEKILHT